MLAASPTPPAEQQASATEVALVGAYARLPDFDSGDEPIWEAVFKWKAANPGSDASKKAMAVEGAIIKSLRDFADRTHALRMQAAPKAAPVTQQAVDVVAYLDVGASGYLDLGSELSEDALQQLPKGRHALVIAGTYGIDGYVAAPQPSPGAQADSVAAPAIGDELRDTLVAVSAAIAERDDRAAQKMICEILVASPTPPAEQQATNAAPAWADQAVIEYRYTGGTYWCPLGPAERMKPDFDGVYRLQAGVYPVEQAAPKAAPGAPSYSEKWDAELGRTAMRFVDRAGDVHPGIDDAETICAEFYKAMSEVIERMPHVQRMTPRKAAPVCSKNRYCGCGMCLDTDEKHDAGCPKAAPVEQNTVPAEWLEQAYREGWAACRDAETIGEEAEDWAFGNSTANSRMIDAQQAAPKQEAQEPAAFRCLHEWDGLTRTSMPPKYACKHCHNFFDAPPSPAPQPAPAPLSDDAVKDAARYRFLAGHCRSTSEHWGGRWSIVVDGPAPKSHDSEDDFDAAIDAALAAQGGKL